MSSRWRGVRTSGLAVAAATAGISGVSVLVNSNGVHDFTSPAVYTTGKNLVATVLLVAVVALVPSMRARPSPAGAGRGSSPGDGGTAAAARRLTPAQWLGLAYVGVVGGGIAFVLFFDGLARTSAVSGAFLHDTLVLWVALCCWPLLRERLSLANVAAIAALAVGDVVFSGGIGHLSANLGNLLVLVATWCWAAEAVVAKRLLRSVAPGTMALVRMGVGVVTLFVYLGVSGQLGAFVFDPHQLGWLVATGCLLGGYVATWMVALARARAVDVTSVLVASVAITAVLQQALGRVTLGLRAGVGLALVAAGTAALVVFWRRWGAAAGEPRRAPLAAGRP